MITVLVLNGVANILTFINMLIAGTAGEHKILKIHYE